MFIMLVFRSLPKELKKTRQKTTNCDETFLRVCRVILYVFFFVIVLGSGVAATLVLLSLIAIYGKVNDLAVLVDM